MEASVNIQLNQERCIKCKNCIRTCYQNVYSWDDLNKRVIVAYPEDCVTCVMCTMNCPRQCIDIIPLPVHKFDPLKGE